MSMSANNEQYTAMSLQETKKTALWRSIQKKLNEKDRTFCMRYFLGVLSRLGAQACRPSPNDKITNPLAIRESQMDYGAAIYSNVVEKRIAYNRALDAGAVAYTGFKQTVPLGSPGAEFNDVEYIAGLWRVQKKFPYEITDVRDRQFVLVEKLPRQEHTKFEFWAAAAVVWYGGGVSADVAHPDWVVARYDTDRGTYMAYGTDIKSARAYLGIKLYDEYQDLIDAEIRQKSHEK